MITNTEALLIRQDSLRKTLEKAIERKQQLQNDLAEQTNFVDDLMWDLYEVQEGLERLEKE